MMLHMRGVKPGMVLQRDPVHGGKNLVNAESKLLEAMITILNLQAGGLMSGICRRK